MRKKEQTESFEDAIPKPSNIYIKLWKAKHEIGKIVKGNDNPFFKSKYADLNTILEACEPILLKYDLILLQPVKGGCVHTWIIDVDNGDRIESYLDLPNIVDPQKMIAAVTYYRRASLQSLLSLQAVDDDGNTAKEASKQTLTNERFQKAIKAINDGKFDVKVLREKYHITPEQHEILLEL